MNIPRRGPLPFVPEPALKAELEEVTKEIVEHHPDIFAVNGEQASPKQGDIMSPASRGTFRAAPDPTIEDVVSILTELGKLYAAQGLRLDFSINLHKE